MPGAGRRRPPGDLCRRASVGVEERDVVAAVRDGEVVGEVDRRPRDEHQQQEPDCGRGPRYLRHRQRPPQGSAVTGREPGAWAAARAGSLTCSPTWKPRRPRWTTRRCARCARPCPRKRSRATASRPPTMASSAKTVTATVKERQMAAVRTPAAPAEQTRLTFRRGGLIGRPSPMRDDLHGRPCSIAAALKQIGEKWALLAVREIAFGNRGPRTPPLQRAHAAV
jgi:hypothetical protein